MTVSLGWRLDACAALTTPLHGMAATRCLGCRRCKQVRQCPFLGAFWRDGSLGFCSLVLSWCTGVALDICQTISSQCVTLQTVLSHRRMQTCSYSALQWMQ